MSGDPVMTTSPKVDHQASPARRKESTSLPSASAKPLWAPRETDAPITLDTGREVHVCQLCGCWYETLQGLSSHARYHLREMGIPDGDVKGNPVDFLHKIMEDGEQKFVGAKQQEKKLAPDSSARSSLKRSSMQSAPPQSSNKRPKPSEDFTCILCGERFENKKGLGSHARSHLRHIGVSDIVGRSSAVEAVQELVNSGMLEPVRLPKTKTGTISSTASSPVPSSPAARARPSASRQPWASLSSSSLSAGHAKTSPSPQAPSNKAPKAKKGFRLAVDPLHRKPKPEPLEMEVSAHPPTTSSSPMQSPGASESHTDSDMQSPPTVLCDYCGQLFETRKALSCHARAHLRQLGISWSIRSSPLDILREVMMQGEEGKKEALNGGKTPWTSRKSSDSLPSASAASSSCASPLDFSMKEKSLPLKETSCELCGFDFENRKALASHARAHLRQLGIIEWKIEGASSPIELLSELIRKDPLKVSQITHRYRMGDLYIKKSQRSTVSPSPSTDSDSVAGSSFKSFTQQQQQQENKSARTDSGAAAGSSRPSQGVTRATVTHDSSSTRSPRGVHPPKHGTTGQTHQHSNSQQPPRSGGIPALLPKPPLTPLVKLVGKIYSLKCRFCEEVFEGPLAVQEQWITHLQKHILTVGFKGKTALPATPVSAPAFVQPVAV